jgi:FkbM family methyltransferase
MEADSENFQQMTINRPDAINLFGAMCFGDSASFQPGSLSKATGGVLTDMSDQFKEKWVDSAAPAARRPVVKVPCMQVSQVLQEYDIAHVDVFFLDVEGGELTVLQTIDFDAGIQFDMFVVEMDNTDPTKDETIRAMLQSRGYISPFSMRKECEKKQPNCRTSELFVLEKVWRERDHQRG